MRVLFDQSVPRPLAKLLIGHEVKRSAELGWAKLDDGTLLTVAENSGFSVLLSGDKTIRYEQNMAGRTIAIVYLSDNHWPIVKSHVPAISEAIGFAKPGEISEIFCGKFVPYRFR